jgi:hypothetical protein
MVKRVISGEGGRVLVWTLVILGLGTLLIPPLLAHVSTSLLATRAIEESLKEQYAADAGVEHAIFRMSTGEYDLGESFDTPTPVNNLPVSVTITLVVEDVYKIVSEAEDTRIESYVSTESTNLLWLLENAITSLGDVELSPNSSVGGDVVYGTEGAISPSEELLIDPGEAIYDDDLEDNWPSASDMAYFYWMDVYDLDPYPDAIIDVTTGTVAIPYPIEPLYYVGYGPDRLSIENGDNDYAWAVLAGTVYVEGDLNIGTSGHDFTLDLNAQTIYVEGDIDVGGKVTFVGSGCIIAEEDIFFLPHIESGGDDFVLLMSVQGETQLNPQDSFVGAVVGDVRVDLQPGNTLAWTSPYGKGLNFPNGSKGFLEFVTYHIY